MSEATPPVRRLLEPPEPGTAAARVRQARQALLEASSSAEQIEQTGLESAVLALRQALSNAGLAQAAHHCIELAGSFHWVPSSSPTQLAELNQWVYPRSLRRYQLAILDGHAFSLQLGNASYVLQRCNADPDRNHLLLQREGDHSLWWLPSEECSEGYRLEASALRPADGSAAVGTNPAVPAVVRAGNSNFAHFLWNELDPLLRLAGTQRTLELVQDTDTVLNLGELDGVQRLGGAPPAEHNSVRLGGTLVSEQARRTVLAALAKEVSTPLPAQRPQPLVLLGVRGPGRRELRNEVAFLSALIDALTRHFQRPLILLDGFTYQHNNQDHPQAEERERACTARAREIMQRCPQAQLENLSGLNFASWLQRSEGVRFYVSHEGTMQHKLGWLRPEIPGLILVGSARAEAIAHWHRLQCEGAGALTTLPTDLMRQEPITAAEQAQEQERNQPFEILNIERAVALTMQQITAELELPEPAQTAAADES